MTFSKLLGVQKVRAPIILAIVSPAALIEYYKCPHFLHQGGRLK